MQIISFIKDAYGKPYIPGSSIKGMLRTILLCYDILNNKNKKNNPLCKFTNDLKNIKKKNINIFPMVIKNGRNNEIEIEGLPDSRIMTIKDFSYYIYKNQSAEQKYTIDELKKYSKTIGKIVNGHN